MALEELLEVIFDGFPIDVHSTEALMLPRLQPDTRVYSVNTGSSLFLGGSYIGMPHIIDSGAGRRIACHPHIVGAELEWLSMECAIELRTALRGLCVNLEGLGILHILRGAPGYWLAPTFPGVPVFTVRTEYREDGYRAHSDDSRRIEVTFRDYPSGVETHEISTLLIPDTYATGMSAETSLRDLLGAGLEPGRVILYGFLAIPALLRLGRLCQEHDIELLSFAICDITQLAHNNYDMPLYGPDESLFSEIGEVRAMGSIVDVDTLGGMLPEYVAGLDQPGDWSERHLRLFNGVVDEDGDIEGHLRKSLGIIESLKGLNSGQPWYSRFHEGIALREARRLSETLSRFIR